MKLETVLYHTDGPIAFVTLNRPDILNTIVPELSRDLRDAIEAATRDQAVKVVVLRGAGRAFCAGYNFGKEFVDGYSKGLETDGQWDPGKDMIAAITPGASPADQLMSPWRCPKPVIGQIHGWCVGGGSDIALCCDILIASEDARIGTPYSRMWGCYITGLWIYRLGLTRLKWHSLTGDPLSGVEAAEAGLINVAVPFERLEAEVKSVADRLAGEPLSQLAAMKLIVNQAYENMGLHSTKTLGPILDGYMRNTPDARRFIDLAYTEGVGEALKERDGEHGDYSQAPAEGKPDPTNVIDPIPPSIASRG